MTMLKWFLLIAGFIVAAAGAAIVFSFGPRNIIGMLRYDQRREGDLNVGDAAPDVPLVGLDGAAEVRLRDHIGPRPLVLVFGSYT